MDEIPVLGHPEDKLLKQLLAHYGVPAYARRALEVQEAFEQLQNHSRARREEWLQMVRLRLGRLYALAGSWDRLRPWLTNKDQILELQELHTKLKPHLRGQVARAHSSRVLYHSLDELKESIARFNRRWLAYVRQVDLTRVNHLREHYNRYYVLEKECALRSPRLARQGFVRLAPITTADLEKLLPPLPELQLKHS
jgi:hypothetical protein